MTVKQRQRLATIINISLFITALAIDWRATFLMSIAWSVENSLFRRKVK